MNCVPDLVIIMNIEEEDDNELCGSNADATVMHNVDGSHIWFTNSKIAHDVGQILISYTNERGCEALHQPFQKKIQLVNFTLTSRERNTVASQTDCTFRQLWVKLY